jgi:hypothetical protein
MPPLASIALTPEQPVQRLQAAVRLLFRRGNEDLRAGLDLAFVARDISDDRGLRRDDDFVLAILSPATACSTLALVMVLCGCRSQA